MNLRLSYRHLLLVQNTQTKNLDNNPNDPGYKKRIYFTQLKV